SRIAEIFGGGQEPPLVVTNEMISEMIKIMGAPEDYSEEATSRVMPSHPSRRKTSTIQIP
ncbi:MAG TPA: hypothetical protein PLP69_08005, partial [Bacteroidales bacterium]|nr:hypothetical protein [Bacteroidales bacterium]